MKRSLSPSLPAISDVLVSLRNALEGFDKADGTMDSQVTNLHNLVHAFLNGTNARPHSAANDPVFVVCSKTPRTDEEVSREHVRFTYFSITLRFAGVSFSVGTR